jgi:hypothetical protein
MTIWYIYMAIWYIIFSRVGMLYQEKSGNPGPRSVNQVWTEKKLFSANATKMKKGWKKRHPPLFSLQLLDKKEGGGAGGVCAQVKAVFVKDKLLTGIHSQTRQRYSKQLNEGLVAVKTGEPIFNFRVSMTD